MIARGVSPDLGTPVKVEHVSTATPRQKGAFLLFLIPMFALLSPLYWVLMSIATWKGFLQLITSPSYWEKTSHGLDRASAHREG